MYREFYRLSDEPFRVTPDPDFLFLAPQYKEALAAIVYGIAKRKGFVCITGEVGVGKTTILRSYLGSVENNGVTFVYIFNPKVSFTVLMRTILRDLHLPTDGEVAEMVDRLHEHLIACYRDGKTVVLFIDEAQNMPVDTLENMRMLSNLETATEKLIQIVLVGQPELDELLSRRELRPLKSRIVVRANLRPMNRRDSLDYIQHRLKRVALGNDPVFTKSAIARIVKDAQGVPRTINILADAALITGFGYRVRPVTAKIVREVALDTIGQPKRGLLPWVASTAALTAIATGLGIWAMTGGLLALGHDQIGDLIASNEDIAAIDTHVAESIPATVSAPVPPPVRAAVSVPPPVRTAVAPPVPAPVPRAAVRYDPADEGPDAGSDLVRVPAAPPPPSPPPVTAQAPAAEPPPAATEHRPAVMVVKAGDTLSKLSKEIYGAATSDTIGEVQRNNPAITNVNKVFIGQVITFPTLPGAKPVQQEAHQ
jgi:general secretion pathway protein A